jgi:hypothetical protein
MLPAAPPAPALAPLRSAQSTPRRAQTILLEGTFRGELDEVMPRLPAFDRVPFAAAGGIDNRFLDAIVRREEPGRGLPAVPVAVVSKRYQLRPPDKGAVSRRRAGGSIGVHPRDMQAEAQLSTYGARMALQVRLPREYDFDPGDGHPLALRLVCLNSVDGSTPLRMLLGWYRFVCANGLAVGTTRCEWRLVHREGMMPADVAPLLQAGLELAEREKLALREWRATPVSAPRLGAFADGRLAAAWGVRLAARFLHIAVTGYDAELAFPFEPGPPSAKTLTPTRRVPGSPAFAHTAWDACQALAWLAKERKDPRERVERLLQIPELMQALMGGN